MNENPELEVRLWVAHRLGRLPEYWEGTQAVSIVDFIDDNAYTLFHLLNRPAFSGQGEPEDSEPDPMQPLFPE